MKIPEEVIRQIAKLADIPPCGGEALTVAQPQEKLLNTVKKIDEHYKSNEATPRNIARLRVSVERLTLIIDALQHPVPPHRPIVAEGGRWRDKQPPIIPQTFAAQIARLINEAHRAVAARNKQPVAKKIEHHAGELIKHLRAFNDPLSENDEIFCRLAALQRNTKLVSHTRVRHQLGWVRRNFVEGLRWAAEEAGGRLTLNRRKEGGTLVDAIVLLRPYLPEELRAGMSFATLRRICAAQISKKRSRKH